MPRGAGDKSQLQSSKHDYRILTLEVHFQKCQCLTGSLRIEFKFSVKLRVHGF